MGDDVMLGTSLSDCLHLLRQAKEEGSIHQLPSDHFKKVITCCKKLAATPHSLLPPSLTDLANILLETLADCSLSFENQILASTAFCLILILIQEPLNISLLFSKNFISASTDSFQVKLSKNSELTINVRKPDVFKLCACNGLLQLGDSFWSSQHLNWNALMFSKMFPLFEAICFSYTHLTHLSFKALKLWLMKVNASSKPSRKLLPDILMRIIRIIMSNWENPISGIREQNLLLFEQCLTASESVTADSSSPNDTRYLNPQALMDLIFTEQSWMTKSKYFMLSVLIPKNGTSKVLASYGGDIVAGLLYSLSCTHLVSAGTDLYKVIIEEMTLDVWQQLFLPSITGILSSSKQKLELQKQNIFNYWLHPTIKKFREALKLVLNALHECDGNPEKDIILAVICCLKLGRKEGYDTLQWDAIQDSKFLSWGLKHCDENIRSHSFAIVSISSKLSLVPSEKEFHLVKVFLTENISGDQPALRHSMVGSLASFLCRIRDSCSQIISTSVSRNESLSENSSLSTSMDFLEWLCEFLIQNLEIGSNYQRKVTSLEIYKIVLSYFTIEAVPTMVQRRGSLKGDKESVMKHAVSVGKWNFTSDESRESLFYCISDPAADVREAAATLLMTYFTMGDKENDRLDDLYQNGVALCSHPTFYCAESGALLVRVVVGMRRGTGRAQALLQLAQTQAHALREDVLRAAATAPLHGVLTALSRLVLDPSSPEHNRLTEADRLKLITLVETTTTHLLQVLSSKSSNISSYAPSFSEMGKAIENVVRESSVTVEDGDPCRISPAYQLVLNCIWLNLKTCCAVASGLVTSYGCSGLGVAEAWRCAEVPLAVLRQCRHKGALEAAGGALAQLVRALSSEGLVADIARVLCDSLGTLESRTTMTTSTRGAGFVIMIHRAVAADTRPNKPLVEMVMTRLMAVAESGKGDVCQALQLLAALVQDSSLTQEMAKHFHSLILLSFNAIASSEYPIRNGGLQLFGAAVGRVVGQRGSVALEEVQHHCPALGSRLLTELRGNCEARLVAALSLVSALIPGPLALVDRTLGNTLHHPLIEATKNLLVSPAVNVRKLASRANAWLYLPSHLSAQVHNRMWPTSLFLTDRTLHTDIVSENQLHGYLLNTKLLIERMNQEKVGNSSVANQLKQVDYKTIDQLASAQLDKISFTCRAVLSEISNYDESKPANRHIEDVIAAVSQAESLSIQKPYISIGLYVWTSKEINKIISNCPLDKLVPSLYTCLIHCENYELHKACLGCLMPRIKSPKFKEHAMGILNILNHYISLHVENVDCSQAMELVLEILVRFKEDLKEVSSENVVKALTSDSESWRVQAASSRAGVLAAIVGVEGWNGPASTAVVHAIATVVASVESGPPADEDARCGAARALSILASTSLPRSIAPILWHCAVTLLQDESPAVRAQASLFVSTLACAQPHEVWNPSVSLRHLFEYSTMTNLMDLDDILQCLWSFLKCTSTEMARLESIADNTVSNPFEVGTGNIYAEPIKVIEYAHDSLNEIIRKQSDVINILPNQQIIPHLKALKDQCQKISKFYEENQLSNESMISNIWYIISKKISCMYRIINHVNNLGDEKEIDMFKYRYYSFLEQMV